MRKMNITLSESSIDKAISKLTAMRDSIDEKTREVVEKLSEIGASSAEMVYGFPVKNEVLSETEATVTATHDGITFIEFGAGIMTDSDNRLAEAMPFPVRRGSYSDENGGEYAESGYQQWHFGGALFEGNSGNYVYPRPGMEYALVEMEDRASEVMKEVFENL